MEVRPARSNDRSEWIRMRVALWPESPEDHAPELEAFFAHNSPIAAAFVVERTDGHLGGFLECGIRNRAEGCATSPVAYIEGWWVDPDLRAQGWGARLVAAAESWARSQGFTEIASDADLYNEVSQRAHLALGYEETQRLVCYRKTLS